MPADYQVPINFSDADIADLKARRDNPVSNVWRKMRMIWAQAEREKHTLTRDRIECEGVLVMMREAGLGIRVEEKPDLQAALLAPTPEPPDPYAKLQTSMEVTSEPRTVRKSPALGMGYGKDAEGYTDSERSWGGFKD